MGFKMLRRIWNAFCCVLLVAVSCDSQENALLSPGSFRVISRMFIPVPEGRKATINDVRILHYGRNSTNPKIYYFKDIELLLSDPHFDTSKTTMLYAHGYGEIPSDDNVLYVVRAYLENGGYNTLVLDWGNYAFGNYVVAGLKLLPVGEEAGKALSKAIRAGLPLERLHLVGHSMGAHLMAAASRKLASLGHTVRRLTALDAAFPGFYPPLQILAPPISASAAQFVDAVHTDGGWFGTPFATGHADFWPNGGRAKQPGCPAVSIPATSEDFCSHWRSWRYWSEALNGGEFLARKCDSYEAFQQGQCRGEKLVHMGIKATPDLRGNYYLKTASKQPYALGESGAE